LITKGFTDYLLGGLPDPPAACPGGAARHGAGSGPGTVSVPVPRIRRVCVYPPGKVAWAGM